MKKIFTLVDMLLTWIAFIGAIAIPFTVADGFWDGVFKIIGLWVVCYLVLIAFAAVRALIDKQE